MMILCHCLPFFQGAQDFSIFVIHSLSYLLKVHYKEQCSTLEDSIVQVLNKHVKCATDGFFLLENCQNANFVLECESV